MVNLVVGNQVSVRIDDLPDHNKNTLRKASKLVREMTDVNGLRWGISFIVGIVFVIAGAIGEVQSGLFGSSFVATFIVALVTFPFGYLVGKEVEFRNQQYNGEQLVVLMNDCPRVYEFITECIEMNSWLAQWTTEPSHNNKKTIKTAV